MAVKREPAAAKSSNCVKRLHFDLSCLVGLSWVELCCVDLKLIDRKEIGKVCECPEESERRFKKDSIRKVVQCLIKTATTTRDDANRKVHK
ncbi:hypothetical protein EYC84_010974 [Monilinia fructicola]|uniref:Uncharacterized protein n=1 Tax=Monilinia fructicola TaxID=38448 RepID=A0A5M9J6W1_MONFR|nr:hypothetical protein EYC84_010974 [Monilinia fructicola]